jgi:hypothetical protein
MLLMEGKRIVSLLRQKGLKSEIVGGIYKKKEDIHDIDLIVRRKDAEKDIVILKYSDIDCPVELYVVNDRQYDRLKNALRSTTYENISGKKMRGLRYNKIKIDDL